MKTNLLPALMIVLASTTLVFGQVESGETVVISERVMNDLYVAGGTVTVNTPIEGDLVVAGGTIIVNDSVKQDILVGGGNITLNGYVGDDVRCAGGSVNIMKGVGGDLVVTGGSISIGPGVVVSDNLFVSGGKIIFSGEVRGMVKSAAGAFTMNGRVLGDMDCRGGELTINGAVDGQSTLAAEEIIIGPQARFRNDVRYWSRQGTVDFGNALQESQAIFDPSLKIESGRWEFFGFSSFILLLWYLGTALLMIFIIQYLFSKTMKRAASTVKDSAAKSLGWGVLFLIGVPIAIVVAVFTVIGLPVAALLFIGYITILLFATVIVSLVAGHWINDTYYHSSWSNRKLVFMAFAIFIILKLATLTPVIGPLIMLLLACMVFGGILHNIKRTRKGPETPVQREVSMAE
ncbi:hypothetical protein C900_02168 [Fulvivirga imtechensis AK7]|uniref:DUF8173 domain-containing protein n=1 Tax=Fulvivirga imtechensis AK7 TaxID=1237149 RepID=L8JWD2_9BACT|nr:hypothetical protein [Fulvivirga imtechensis]ELR71929.1 hypothetical protein C900_02168 [Fulvivirga imtechensis AK7]